MTSLGDLPGGITNSVARAVSGTGTRIVGEGHTAAANSVAFIWDQAGGMRDLRSVLIDDFGLGTELAAWDLLSATGVSGDGSVIVGAGINPEGDLEAWRAELDPVPILPGDYNDDGAVDAADYTVWRDTLGSTTLLAADGNLNGTIDAGDYDEWSAHFGAVLGSGANDAVAVPEPTSLVLLMLAAVGVSPQLRWRVRRSQNSLASHTR